MVELMVFRNCIRQCGVNAVTFGELLVIENFAQCATRAGGNPRFLARSILNVLLVFFETEHSLVCHIVGGGSMLMTASLSMNFCGIRINE